jgi:cell division protein FtsI (penicillin-binding protein 3)
MVERRLTWLALAVLLWGGAIFYKLVSLQVLHHQEYVLQARKHQEEVRTIPAPRGTIFDRNGQPLAMSIPTEFVYVNPLKVPDIGVAADILSQFLHLDRVELYGRLKNAQENNRGYLIIKKNISFDEGRHLRNVALDYIKIQTDSQRHYPKGKLAAHILGGVDFSEHGNGGVEKSLDQDLRGVPGQELLLKDVKHRGIDSQNESAGRPGTPITLTIDERLQFVAERELAAGVAAHNASAGSVVVMDPNTGDILALASYPTFDPNLPPVSYQDVVARQNHATAVPFEPGSIFKVVTLSSALETTRLRPETLIDCGRGSITLFGRTIHEAHGGYGTISMAEVLKHSSNVGAIKIGMTVGQQNFFQYIKKFGFGDKTGIPLPGESRGRLRGLKQWQATSLASISIGHEIGVTTIQLARAAAVVANGGLLVQPRLVLKKGSQVTPIEPPVRVIRAETAITMRQMMEGVVTVGGTGYPEARLAGYSVGGKTGSAQIFDFATKHYTHNYNGSFIGLVPLTNPSMVVVVTLNGTHGVNGYGGRAAAPVFHAVATEALRLLEVPKDLPDEPPPALVAQKQAEPDDESAVAEFAAADNILLDSEDDDGQTDPAAGNGPKVPNFKGKTMRDVLAEAASQGLVILPNGNGVARVQYPAAGAILHQGERIRVQFSR